VKSKALPEQPELSGLAFAAAPAAQSAQNNAGAAAPPAQNSLTLDAMNRRQEELDRREQVLRSLEQELDERLGQMQALEMRLQTMLKDAEEARDNKYKHLVDVLSNMKSRQAAEVLESLDEKIAVKVLAGMRGRQAGEILTYAAPGKAARLTEALARMQLPLE
jgi:flagellar motility protein MotE (MotC chaperone)